MTERLPFFEPEKFKGHTKKDILSLVMRFFERMAVVNGWNDTKKMIYFPMYLEEVANIFQKLWTERQKSDMNRSVIKETFITVFAPNQKKEMLLMRLNNMIQLPGESLCLNIRPA